MDKRSAISLIRDTLENPFDKRKFAYLVSNMLDHIEAAPFIYRGNLIPDAYKSYISTLERIGKYKDRKGNKIDLLIVRLKKETSLERARTMQRNFIAWYLNGSRGDVLKDAALAAFVSPDTEDWRFSLVKMDYRLDTSSEKVKVKKELTPARRFSFLVGKNENSHTAQSCLLPVLEKKVQDPTLKELEKVFDIETVTKEFFLKYRELFLHTKEELDRVVKKDPKIKADFEVKSVDTVNFAKKLLGQIIFLYFLQKKGWFGVGRDDDWDTGSKHFLRELFKKKHGDYNNFFNDILEPLFYDALRNDRSHDDGYYSRFNCKIPFLNGGLFDPIGNYDWVHTDILLPNKLFSNQTKTKEGDIGTGILDVFDRYNFTVKEDEPLEKEVAIDPELLGKSYEKFNAIRPDNYAEFKKALKSGRKGEENKFNKKFGVYYTPREIVYYMCQQSLINYLATKLEGKAKKEAIEFFILEGEKYIEHLKTAKEKKEKNANYQGDYKEKEHFIELKKHANEIDNSLSKIKVCDPAVGSGAFPVGMMTEIVKARMFFVETGCLEKIYINSHQEKVKRTPYNFKRDCIEYSLYGVDIDPGAVEIAKLRLWLSLVVDEDDIKNIKPLPNLDYRIMQGNSLISEFMGINFDNNENKNLKKEIEELNAEIKTLKKEKLDKESKSSRHYKKTIEIDQNLLNEINVLDDKINKLKKKCTLLNKKLNHQEESPEMINLISKFHKKKNTFLNESNVLRKSQLKNEVDILLIKIFETKLKTQKADYFNRLKNIENKYSVVRNEKQRDELIKQDKEKFYKESGLDTESAEKQLKEFTSGKKIKPFFLWNLYFSEVFHSKGGFDVVIGNPPYYNVQALGAQHPIANHLKQKYSEIWMDKSDILFYFIYRGSQISKHQINFITSNAFLFSNKARKLRNYILSSVPIAKIINFEKHIVFESATITSCISFFSKKKRNSEAEAMVFKESEIPPNVLEKKLNQKSMLFTVGFEKDNVFALIPRNICELHKKIDANHPKLSSVLKVGKGMETAANDVFSFNDYPSQFPEKYVKYRMSGEIINRYHISKPIEYVLYFEKVKAFEELPNVIQLYLNRHKEYLCGRATVRNEGHSWWRYSRPLHKDYYHLNKLWCSYRNKNNCFTYDNTGKFIGFTNTTVVFDTSDTVDLRYVLALLNSSTLDFRYKTIGKQTGGGVFEYFENGIGKLPIPNTAPEQQKGLIRIVDDILKITKKEDYLQDSQMQVKVKSLEQEIDQLVYKIYDLTPEEIKIVGGKHANTD